MNLRFLSAPAVRRTDTGTTIRTRSTNDAVGPASTDDSTAPERAAADNRMNRDLGWTMTPQHAYQLIAMDVSWEPMLRSRLPVQTVNEPPGRLDRKLLNQAMNRETVKSPVQKQTLVVDRAATKPLPHRRADPAEAKTSSSVRDVPIKMQAHPPRVLQIGPTST